MSIDPSSNPALHAFLEHVSGFDSVDDESKPESNFNKHLAETTPDRWDTNENPPYAYWIYYMYANIAQLNQLRKERGLSSFFSTLHWLTFRNI
mgnify:FL=1